MILAALALFASSLDVNGLRKAVTAQRAQPEAAVAPADFRFELPLVPDRKTDLASLQNPAGYSYDAKTGVLSIDIDMGVVTPDNFKAFDKLNLWEAPPLRTLYFFSRTGKDTAFHITYDAHGDPRASQGWKVNGESFGLAIPASAEEKAVRGGDLPDDFALPFVIQMRVPPQQAELIARSLRVRVEGRLRTIGGRSVLCGHSGAEGYAVDEITQTTPNVILDQQCFLPATLTRISLVRAAGGPPLKAWTRAALDPTPETAETRVKTNRELKTYKPDGGPTSSPNATAPLPKRP